MASPENGIRKARDSEPSGYGNVAWKERIDVWKIKLEKNVAPMSVTTTPSDGRGGGDFDTSTDVDVDDSYLCYKFPKWFPVNRETYLDNLGVRYDREGESSQLATLQWTSSSSRMVVYTKVCSSEWIKLILHLSKIAGL